MSRTKDYLMETLEKERVIAQDMTFEEFLQQYFENKADGILDDDLQDAFEGWCSNLDGEEYITLADKFVALVRSKIEGLTEDNNNE